MTDYPRLPTGEGHWTSDDGQECLIWHTETGAWTNLVSRRLFEKCGFEEVYQWDTGILLYCRRFGD